jgi:hypothetical protein
MPRKKRPADPQPSPTSIRTVPTGRVTTDRPEGPFGSTLSVILPPRVADEAWRTLNLDSKTLDRISAVQLVEYLADISPDVSRALFDFLRECNAGWELDALVPGTEDVDPRAQAALDGHMATLGALYGTPDVPINRLFIAAWLRGALLGELVLDANGHDFVDLATPDPAIARFKPVSDPVRGTVHQLGQMQGGRWVAFDRPTISYIPVDPLPGSPYGRPLVAPALFVTLFLIGLLHDLRRVIAQQGYPRLDISIDLEKLANEMQAQEVAAQQRQAFVDAIVRQVADYYAGLEPDMAFVHTDLTALNRPVGTVDTQSLGGLGPVIEALERMAVRALKTMPFMMAISESNTETQANRQFEQHAIAIRAMQHLVETQLGRLFTLGLQAEGVVATVRMRFAENRRSERLRYAQAEQVEIANERAKYAAGWTSQDEGAQAITGHDADRPEPRQMLAAPASSAASSTNPEPGANRARSSRNGRAKLVPKGAGDPFDPIPASTLGPDDGDGLAEAWDGAVAPKYRGMLEAVVVNGGEEA